MLWWWVYRTSCFQSSPSSKKWKEMELYCIYELILHVYESYNLWPTEVYIYDNMAEWERKRLLVLPREWSCSSCLDIPPFLFYFILFFCGAVYNTMGSTIRECQDPFPYIHAARIDLSISMTDSPPPFPGPFHRFSSLQCDHLKSKLYTRMYYVWLNVSCFCYSRECSSSLLASRTCVRHSSCVV